MKKVIFTQDEQTINVNELTDEHFIGCIWQSGNIGVVTKIEKGMYVIQTIESNEYLSKVTSESIIDIIKSCKPKEVYATLDRQEFINWYVEQLKK